MYLLWNKHFKRQIWVFVLSTLLASVRFGLDQLSAQGLANISVLFLMKTETVLL